MYNKKIINSIIITLVFIISSCKINKVDPNPCENKGPVLGDCYYKFCYPLKPGGGCIQCPGKPNCCDNKKPPPTT